MGDRGVIKFNGYGKDVAAIYVHHSGSYADEVLEEFFTDEVAKHIMRERDNRFDDPSYLAARFVSWYSESDGLGIGIVEPDSTMGDTTWRVYCDSRERPRVERC